MTTSLPDPPGKTAILLINLGTPEAPTPPAIRRYLGQFLSDRKVVDIPNLIWWPILHGIILNWRAKKTAKKYASIWTPQGSPLRTHSELQAKLLRGFLGAAGHDTRVACAMRYGQPSIPDTLSHLQAEGCTRLLILPLYPQYSTSTTASAFDTVFSSLQRSGNWPEVRTIRSFADDLGYIRSLARSVHEHWMRTGHPESSYRLLFSFHGLPRHRIDQGDPYLDECRKTARLLAQELDLGDHEYQTCFQSRFGRREWLKPYTLPSLCALAGKGIRRTDILCPGFPSDCLETLEEIAIGGKQAFIRAGGQEFHYIPCLNERDDWIGALAELAGKHLHGWTNRETRQTVAPCP